MSISPVLSTTRVAYRTAAGVAVTSADADGREYALLSTQILDTTGAPVPGAQVRFVLSTATPDVSALFEHDTQSVNLIGACSFTDEMGRATARLYSQDFAASPLTVLVLAGEDDGLIAGILKPTAANVGAPSSGAHTNTVSGPITIVSGIQYVDTLFTGQVTVNADGVSFYNCTFDGQLSSAQSNVVSRARRSVSFERCTFKNSTSHAVTGWGMRLTACAFTEVGGACLSLSHRHTSPLNHDRTILFRCHAARFGKSFAAPAILAAPGTGITVFGCTIEGYHEESAAGIPGYEMRGAVQVLTRRPNDAGDVEVVRCWLYGGGDYCLDFSALDSGTEPHGIKVLACRFGAPSQFQRADGLQLLARLNCSGYIGQGNVWDDGALLITGRYVASNFGVDINTRGGVGWYHPPIALDSEMSVSFDEQAVPLAEIEGLDSNIGHAPASLPVQNFAGQITAITTTTPRAIVARNRQGEDLGQLGFARELQQNEFYGTLTGDPYSGVDADTLLDVDAVAKVVGGPGAQTNDTQVFDDRYTFETPTAVIYPPSLRAGVAGTAVTIEFDLVQETSTIYETAVTKRFLIVASRPVTEDTVIGITYTGTATRDTDYTAPSTVTIPFGDSSVYLEVVVSVDVTEEGEESIGMTITSLSAGNIGGHDTEYLYIRDFGGAGGMVLPQVQFAQNYITVPEGTTFNIPVEMSKTYGAIVNAEYELILGGTNGLAASEVTDLTGGSVAIAAGTRTANIQIRINQDSLYEPDFEVMSVRLLGDPGNGIIASGETECFVRVYDDEAPPNNNPGNPSPTGPNQPGTGVPVGPGTSGAQIAFTTAAITMTEGEIRSLFIGLSRMSLAPITVPFTVVAGSGHGSGEYSIKDRNGVDIGANIVIPAGSTSYQIVIRSVDDTVDEVNETLTLTLGTPTGDGAGLGALNVAVITVLDNDEPPISGADGNLYGLVPERQVVDLATPDIEVYTNRYEILSNPGLGISASTVMTASPLRDAMRAAQAVWIARNGANVATLQNYAASRLVDGEVVKLRVHGDLGLQQISLGGGDQVSDIRVVVWTSPNMPIVRDLVIYGADGPGQGDKIGAIAPFWKQDLALGSGTYQGQRVAANIRFQRIGIEGNTSNQTAVRSVTGGTLPRTDNYFGFLKFYNCRFLRPRDTSGGPPHGRGCIWTIRAQHRICWDIRGCFFELSEQHAAYVDSPPGGFYFINNTHERGGFGRTFCQVVNRKTDVPGASGYGSVVIMRNVAYDTSSGDVQQGGSDFTVVGFDGPIYLVENESRGLASPIDNGSARGSITIWCDSNRIDKGVHPLLRNDFAYINDDVHIWGHVVDYENGPNQKEAISISATKAVHIKAFHFVNITNRQQFSFDRAGDGVNSMEYINGIPSRHPTHGIFWDLRWPTHTSPAWTGPRSQYPGWKQNLTKIICARSRRLGNYDQEIHTLTNAEVDVFDGTVLWPEGNRKPAGRWQYREDGLPVGATIKIYGGENQYTRSQRVQTWQYRRLLENISSGAFTETRNATISSGDGGATGEMFFAMLDDLTNVESDERPEIDIAISAAPSNPALPGIIRYEITDFGTNAIEQSNGDRFFDLYVYAPGAFATFAWSADLYAPTGYVHEISIADGPTQYVTLRASLPTKMREEVYVFRTGGTTTAVGLNNVRWIAPPDQIEILVEIVDISVAAPGSTLILQITHVRVGASINTGVVVGGITAGNIGIDELTIRFIP